MISTSQQPCAILCLRTAHGARRMEDYEKKSKVFMEPKGILGAKINGGKKFCPRNSCQRWKASRSSWKKTEISSVKRIWHKLLVHYLFAVARCFNSFNLCFYSEIFWGFALLAMPQAQKVQSLQAHQGTARFPKSWHTVSNQRMCSVIIIHATAATRSMTKSHHKNHSQS